jgi:hypothetical protein
LIRLVPETEIELFTLLLSLQRRASAQDGRTRAQSGGWAYERALHVASTVDRRPLLAPGLGFLNLRRKLKEQMLLTKAADKLHANWQP